MFCVVITIEHHIKSTKGCSLSCDSVSSQRCKTSKRRRLSQSIMSCQVYLVGGKEGIPLRLRVMSSCEVKSRSVECRVKSNHASIVVSSQVKLRCRAKSRQAPSSIVSIILECRVNLGYTLGDSPKSTNFHEISIYPKCDGGLASSIGRA